MRIGIMALATGIALGLVAGPCAQGAVPQAPAAARTDFLRAEMDLTVDPGVDFFQYALGGWLKRTPIPASESSWSIGHILREQNYAKLKATNERAASHTAAKGSDEQLVGDFWAAAMDTAKADALGLSPLGAELAKVEAIQTANDAMDLAFAWTPLSVRAFFSAWVGQDEKQSDLMAVHIGQGGLGLPERDFYFNPEQGLVHIRAEYLDHLARTLMLLGRPGVAAKTAAGRVMAFETELARGSRRLEDLRDPLNNYHKMVHNKFHIFSLELN